MSTTAEKKTIKIMNRFGGLLREVKADSLRLALENEAKRGAYLGGAYLRGADLGGADLGGAYLRGAYLGGAKLNWQSHALLGELLLRAAESDIEKRKIAGLITISVDWCWDKFLALDDPLRDWALDTLAEYVVDGDDSPEEIRARVKPPVEEAAP